MRLRVCANAGVSSNGRTAVSGAVCEGSIPSTPATEVLGDLKQGKTMKIVDLLDKRSVKFGVDAKSKEDAIRQICHLMAESGKIDDVENYISGVLDREDIATTGVGNFIAMPHCQGDFINSAGLAVMKFNEGVN